ncbi:MAG: hypothetical protein EXX96DRAFT_577346 [Benjaminiella poitrasii]|nr:MAG: hypothetical protein EXX96DRAFT_577346 [Benjaminiella poitrasii]
MGFCQRCGEITAGKCKRCGGRSVESTISTLISEGVISVVDRWQSQYAGTILAPEEIIEKKSPTTKRIPVTQSTFYNPPSIKRNICTCCSKPLDYRTSIMEDGAHYCKECHIKLFIYTKGECPTCRKSVSEQERYIEYASKTWHTTCFVCFNCQSQLESDPLVDLNDRPCCEPCFLAQAGRRSQDEKKHIKKIASSSPSPRQYDSYSSQSSLSTIGSSSSSNLSFYNSNQRRLSKSRIMDQSLFISPSLSSLPPLSRTPSLPEEEEKITTKATRHHNPSVSIPTKSSSYQQHSNTQEPSKPVTSLSQTPCHYCHRPLGDATTQKKVKVPLGQHNVWFHKSCFLCIKCRKPFQKDDGQQCKTDGHAFYHARCEFVQCEGCQKAIQHDSFKFNDKQFHFDCFRCYANGCPIRLGEPVFELGGHPFCSSCHLLATTNTMPTTNTIASTTSKKRSLPILGGSKRCPRCKESISIMDDTPGPLATRWHKKCLSCATCSKSLDSAAKLRQGSQGESLVYCRSCIIHIC